MLLYLPSHEVCKWPLFQYRPTLNCILYISVLISLAETPTCRNLPFQPGESCADNLFHIKKSSRWKIFCNILHQVRNSRFQHSGVSASTGLKSTHFCIEKLFYYEAGGKAGADTGGLRVGDRSPWTKNNPNCFPIF